MTNQIFGKLTILKDLGMVKKTTRAYHYALCKCECGNELEVLWDNLKRGKSTECRACANTKHNMNGTPEQKVWTDMRNRCYNPNHKNYKEYGGRGIKVCDEWLSKSYGFMNFFNDMGNRPSKLHTLDRINNDGNYEKSNCRWATKKQQANNRRKAVKQ